MILKWEDGHEVVKPFGMNVNGVHHNFKRPSEIVISPFELLSENITRTVEYIHTELLQSAKLVRFKSDRSP